MLRVRRIESFELPDLQPYRTMRRQLEHRAAGIFVAEGEKVVQRLLASEFEVVSALMPQKWFDLLEPVLRARPEKVEVFVADKSLLETLTGFSMYQGLLAVGKVPTTPPLQDILDRARRPLLLAAVDGLSSAENLGALVRNCAAFNVGALIVGETCTSPFLRRAVRSSMGAVFEIPIFESTNLVRTIEIFKAGRVTCVAAHPHARGLVLPDAELRKDCCIVFGSEGYGISRAILDLCDASAAVPMPPNVDSLNVGSAAAVFLYEANRQREVWRPRKARTDRG